MRDTSMRWRRRLIGLVAVAVAILLGWSIGRRAAGDPASADMVAQEGANGAMYRDVAGRVVKSSPDDGVFTVDHEAIPGFMPAMVMDLEVADPAELMGLSPGEEVVFDLVRIGESYQVMRIRPADEAAGRRDPSGVQETPAHPLGRGDLVPDLALIDAQGEGIQLRGLGPRHKVITFFYARCPLQDYCPAQSQRLAELQNTLDASGSDIHLLSLTLDAENDTAEVLADYGDRFGADPDRWTLAGSDDPETIRDFARRAGARVQTYEDRFDIDHALVALRIDGDRIVDVVYGLEMIESMVRGMEGGEGLRDLGTWGLGVQGPGSRVQGPGSRVRGVEPR